MGRVLRLLTVLLLALATNPPLFGNEQPATKEAATWPPPEVKELVELLREGEPAFTREQASTYARELVPLVEEAAGRKLKRAPSIELVSRAELAEVLSRELQPQLRNLFPKLNEEEVKGAADAQARLLAPMLLGKFGTEDKVLYLMPRNLYPLLKLVKIDEKHATAMTRLVIAHELAHALQDQEVGLQEKLCQARSLDECQAVNATIEGHAVFIQEKVGRALMLDDALQEHARALAAGAVKLEDPALELLNRTISVQFEQITLGGKKFIGYHYREGGTERLWQILVAPPTETSMIANPAGYSPLRGRKLDYAKMLEGLEQDFGAGDWTVQNIELGQMMLRSAYALLEESRAEEIISQVERAQTLIAITAEPFMLGNVSIVVLKKREYGPKLIAAVEEAARKNVEKMKSGSFVGVSDLVMEDFAGIKADVARKLSMNILAPGDIRVKQVVVRVCRGRVMVEILDANIGLTDEKIIGIAEKVFQRHEALVSR